MKFSIVIPTQNRSALLDVVLRYATTIDYNNYEVIVSDNSTADDEKELNKTVFEKYAKKDCADFIRLVAPSAVLTAPEHFEFALGHAIGDYIIYLTDKMLILPDALKDLDNALLSNEYDIVNWGYAHYQLSDMSKPFGEGFLDKICYDKNIILEEFDPNEALITKASGKVPRNKQNNRVFSEGKIVFGCYSQRLIERIRDKTGRVFGGCTHDYSAMIQALILAEKCLYLNKTEIIFLSLPLDKSLGSLTASKPEIALNYYLQFNDATNILNNLLIPNLYSSQHNMVAHDYIKYLSEYNRVEIFGRRNWIMSVFDDLSGINFWRDKNEKDRQFQIFYDHLRTSFVLSLIFYLKRTSSMLGKYIFFALKIAKNVLKKPLAILILTKNQDLTNNRAGTMFSSVAEAVLYIRGCNYNN